MASIFHISIYMDKMLIKDKNTTHKDGLLEWEIEEELRKSFYQYIDSS